MRNNHFKFVLNFLKNYYMTEKTFRITEVIDLNENATIFLVDENLENVATVVIKDANATVYYKNGETKDYGEDFQSLIDDATNDNLVFIKKINGEDRWEEYNPNPKKKNVGDCSIRAYCKATGVDWDTAFNWAAEIGKEEKDIINSSKVCDRVIKEKVGMVLNKESRKVPSKERPTVNEFCLTHNYGTYILHIRGHLCTVVNGRFYDTWNCGKKKVTHFYEFPNE